MTAQVVLEPADAARRVLEKSAATGTEVLVAEEVGGLTRFANSEIHQNVGERTVWLRVRVIDGTRVGVRGTGCRFASVLATALARGETLPAAAREAKRRVRSYLFELSQSARRAR